MSGYGPIVTGTMVRNTVRDQCKLWLPYYLSEMDRLSGRIAGTLPAPRGWEAALRAPRAYLEGEQLPVGVVVAPGLADLPVRYGGGLYAGTWSVGVGIIVSGQSRDNTLELAELYAAAVRTALTQHRSLGGFAANTQWVGERYDDLEDDAMRTIAAAVVQFYVTVENIADERQGPPVPPPDEDHGGPPPTEPMPEPATVTGVAVQVKPTVPLPED